MCRRLCASTDSTKTWSGNVAAIVADLVFWRLPVDLGVSRGRFDHTDACNFRLAGDGVADLADGCNKRPSLLELPSSLFNAMRVPMLVELLLACAPHRFPTDVKLPPWQAIPRAQQLG